MAIKGTVTRPIPEWLVRLAATGGFIYIGATGQFPFIGLYNNAADGSSLWVYSVAYNGVSGGGSQFWQYEQGSLGTLAGAGLSVVSDQSVLPGQIYYGDYPTYTTAVSSYRIVANFLGFFQVELGIPLAVLRPNTQLNFTTSVMADTITVGFYWVAISGDTVSSG